MGKHPGLVGVGTTTPPVSVTPAKEERDRPAAFAAHTPRHTSSYAGASMSTPDQRFAELSAGALVALR